MLAALGRPLAALEDVPCIPVCFLHVIMYLRY